MNVIKVHILLEPPAHLISIFWFLRNHNWVWTEYIHCSGSTSSNSRNSMCWHTRRFSSDKCWIHLWHYGWISRYM